MKTSGMKAAKMVAGLQASPAQWRARILGAAVASLVALPLPSFGWDNAKVPLFWATGAKPNVVIDVDDSRSMFVMVANEKFQAYQEKRLYEKADGTVLDPLLNPPVIPGDMTASSGNNTDTDDYNDKWYFCTAYTNSTKTCTATDEIDRLSTGSNESFSFQTPLLTPTALNRTITSTSTAACTSPCLRFATPGRVFFANHGFFNGTRVVYTKGSGAANITGLVSGSSYYVVNATANDFQLANTLGGAAIALSGTNQTKSHTFSGTVVDLNPATYIYSDIGSSGMYQRPGARSPKPVLCDVTKLPGDTDFVLTDNMGLVGNTVPASENIGALVTKTSGSSANTASCVRFKEASTAKSPPAPGVAALTQEDRTAPGLTKDTYPASVDVYSAMDFRFTLFQLNKLIGSNVNKSYNFSDTAVYPDVDLTPGVDTPDDFKVMPNLNRIHAARMALQKVVVDNYNTANIGLFHFNDSNNGEKLLSCNGASDNANTPVQQRDALVGSTLDASTIAGTLDGLVGGLRPDNGTPLSRSAYEVTKYFQGATGLNASYTSPINYRCQKNYMIAMTDGEPTSADNPSGAFNTSPWPNYDGKTDPTNWYLDDVAQYAWDTDMKTSGNDKAGKSWDDPFDGGKWSKQNVVSYALGFGLQNDLLKLTPLVNSLTFATSAVNTTGDTILLPDHGLKTGDLITLQTGTLASSTTTFASDSPASTAGKYYAIYVDKDNIQVANSQANAQAGTYLQLGGSDAGTLSIGPGRAFFAFTAEKLAADLGQVFNDINQLEASASAVATNSSSLDTNTLVYQARFDTEDWSGEIAAYKVNENTGKVDTKAAPAYTTKNTLKTAGDRGTMLTWNPDSNAGVDFEWANLGTTLQGALNGEANTVSWLKGNTVSGFRDHSSKGLLGDVLNSDPAYVGALNYGYFRLPASDLNKCTIGDPKSSGTGCTGAETYVDFINKNKSSRTPMLYLGANDGMLHGFQASNLQEKLAFLPAGVYVDWNDTNNNGVNDDGAINVDKKLYALTQTGYLHRFFVDGSPTAMDAFVGGSWKTFVAGGLGAGGRSVYLLDVTDPSSFDANDVKWEFTHPELGYTFSKPIIARLKTGAKPEDGGWYAIFGNGSDSQNDRAKLFIVNLEDRTDFTILTTDTSTPNGLMSINVVVDANRTVTTIYGGDLKGNIWRFDVSGNSWSNGTKLFTATDSSGNVQPITGGISLGIHPKGLGILVYFGTGKYFENADKEYVAGTTKPKFDTFYGVLDNSEDGNLTRSNLQVQTLTEPYTGIRVGSTNPVNYKTSTSSGKYGWYIDLAVGTTYEGERVVSTPKLFGSRMIVVSMVPAGGDVCVSGGSSWLYEFDALTGKNLDERVLDTNGDGKIDSTDKISAGIKLDGIASEPTIIHAGEVDYKLMGSTSRDSSVISVAETPAGDSMGGGAGRMSWQQLQ